MSTREENDKQREDKIKENGGKTNMEVRVHKQEQKKDDEIEKVEFSLGSNNHIGKNATKLLNNHCLSLTAISMLDLHGLINVSMFFRED